MKSSKKGFYSLYLFLLLGLIGASIVGYYAIWGREKNETTLNHILMQMQIYENNLKALTKNCLQLYSLNQCKHLSFDFRGYKAEAFITQVQNDFCLLDFSIELINPLNSQIIRQTKREVWSLKNLKQGNANGEKINAK